MMQAVPECDLLCSSADNWEALLNDGAEASTIPEMHLQGMGKDIRGGLDE